MKPQAEKDSRPVWQRASIFIYALLFLSIGFALRLHFANHQACYWRAPNSYISIARNLDMGIGFLDTESNFGIPDKTRRPPLVPYLLYKFMDAKGRAGGIPVFLFFQAILGSLTALLLALLGWRLTYSKGVFYFLLPLACFWGPSLGLAPCVMTETTFIFLFVAACLLLLEAFRLGRYPFFVTAGLLVGLASLARPILYPLYFFLAVSWPWLFRSRDKIEGKKKAIAAFCFFATLLVVIVPWMIRNTMINGRLTLITSSVGLNLLMENTDAKRPEMWKNLMDQSVPGEGLSGIDEATRDRVLADRALADIGKHPGRFIGRFIDRLIHLFNGSMDNFPDLVVPIAWHHLAVIPLIIGLVLLFLTRPAEGLLLSLLELNFIVIYGLTFFEARFRETVVPIHLVLACLGGLYLIRKAAGFIRRKQSPGAI